jgi:stearoyl-CoA desaturase (delta-9 desaturase)
MVYHRLLSHRSWNAPYWYEIFGTLLGIFSFTGTPITRTLAHRYHHAYTETNNDPHSPRVHGIVLAYLPMLKNEKLNPLIVRDLLNHKFHRFIHENYLTIIITTLLTSLLLFGFIWTVVFFVAPGALCWMNISICNIGCHWGGDNDPIKQSKLLAWLTFGEGYHEYHHDKPNDPNFGNGKFDIGYFFIKLLEKKNIR